MQQGTRMVACEACLEPFFLCKSVLTSSVVSLEYSGSVPSQTRVLSLVIAPKSTIFNIQLNYVVLPTLVYGIMR